jgi:hypothetical protein
MVSAPLQEICPLRYISLAGNISVTYQQAAFRFYA